jgi:hypothetical protein
MSSESSDRELYVEARRRVVARKNFYIHLVVYILVNALLIAIWATTDVKVPEVKIPWFIYPLVGWGIGILFHFLAVFVFSASNGWEKRAIEKEVERMKKDNK